MNEEEGWRQRRVSYLKSPKKPVGDPHPSSPPATHTHTALLSPMLRSLSLYYTHTAVGAAAAADTPPAGTPPYQRHHHGFTTQPIFSDPSSQSIHSTSLTSCNLTRDLATHQAPRATKARWVPTGHGLGAEGEGHLRKLRRGGCRRVWAVRNREGRSLERGRGRQGTQGAWASNTIQA